MMCPKRKVALVGPIWPWREPDQRLHLQGLALPQRAGAISSSPRIEVALVDHVLDSRSLVRRNFPSLSGRGRGGSPRPPQQQHSFVGQAWPDVCFSDNSEFCSPSPGPGSVSAPRPAAQVGSRMINRGSSGLRFSSRAIDHNMPSLLATPWQLQQASSQPWPSTRRASTPLETEFEMLRFSRFHSLCL